MYISALGLVRWFCLVVVAAQHVAALESYVSAFFCLSSLGVAEAVFMLGRHDSTEYCSVPLFHVVFGCFSLHNWLW